MVEQQMTKLLDTLKTIHLETLDIDDFLEQRECDPFDGEWVRVYQAVEELKKRTPLRTAEKSRRLRISRSMKNRRMMIWQDTSLMTLA